MTKTMTKPTVFKRSMQGCSYELHLSDNKQFLSKVREEIDLFLFSPPYNIGSKSPAMITDRRNGGYDAKSYRGITDYPDTLPEPIYQAQQVEILKHCAQLLSENGVIVYNHKNRYKNGILSTPYEWLSKTGLNIIHEITWDRGSTHENGRSHPRPIDEKLFVLSGSSKSFYAPRHCSKQELENVSTVWRIPPQRDNLHNAAFPLELALQIVKLYSPKGGLVSDIYSGSGTTMIASFLTGRNFVGCEILQKYFATAIERFALTKNKINEYSY